MMPHVQHLCRQIWMMKVFFSLFVVCIVRVKSTRIRKYILSEKYLFSYFFSPEPLNGSVWELKGASVRLIIDAEGTTSDQSSCLLRNGAGWSLPRLRCADKNKFLVGICVFGHSRFPLSKMRIRWKWFRWVSHICWMRCFRMFTFVSGFIVLTK